MGSVDSKPAEVNSPPRGNPLFLVGFALFLLGPAIYFVRFRLNHFDVPWYSAILASAGVAFMAVSIRAKRGVWRSVGLALFVALCGFEWFMLLHGTRTPDYTGPATAGKKLPPFTTALADGTSFTEKDLERDGPTVLLFFRGRW